LTVESRKKILYTHENLSRWRKKLAFGVARFFLDTIYQNVGKIYHIATKLPTVHKIFQMPYYIPNGHKIYKTFPI
jgi:hypothetical protein